MCVWHMFVCLYGMSVLVVRTYVHVYVRPPLTAIAGIGNALPSRGACFILHSAHHSAHHERRACGAHVQAGWLVVIPFLIPIVVVLLMIFIKVSVDDNIGRSCTTCARG
jgi:hypothetical protein